MIKFPFSAPTLLNGRTLISVSSGFLEIRIPLGLPGFQGKVSPGPPCCHPPCWHHRGVPTPTVFCHIVLVPPAHWLPEPRLCYSQKHRVQAAVLTLSWASRNSEGLSEDLHIPHSAGHFLGLNLHALYLSFSKLPWGAIIPPPDLAQGHTGHRNSSQRPTSPHISSPHSDFHA